MGFKKILGVVLIILFVFFVCVFLYNLYIQTQIKKGNIQPSPRPRCQSGFEYSPDNSGGGQCIKANLFLPVNSVE